MFIIPSTTIQRCLKHEGIIGQGKDFLTGTTCMIHLYSFQGKSKFGLQVYQNVSKQFVQNKIQQLSKTFIDHSSPNISRVIGFSKYSHSNKLIDLSILYDLGNCYGVSLQNIIANKRKNNVPFKESEILDFLTQILDVLINTSTHTSEYLQLTPINIFATIQPKHNYSYFPNNFGLSFEGTQWQKLYFNYKDTFFKQKTLQNGINSILFAIGMMTLEMCTLQQSNKIYQNKQINQKILQKSLLSIKLNFSSSLFDFISKLCSLNQQQRIKISDIYQQNSILTKHKQGIFTQEKIKQSDFQGYILNKAPVGICKISDNQTSYCGSLNSNYQYDGYGILTTETQFYKGQFLNNEFKLGQYYVPGQYILFGSLDSKGNTTGFKMALSGNKSFLYQSGIFNIKKQLIKGKMVQYNGKSTQIDLATRHDFSRLSGASINMSKYQI